MEAIDFNRSYINFRLDRSVQPAITVTHAMPTTVNNVRINIECRCELTNAHTSESHVFVLGASCKTERVGADRDVWLDPNADFCLVASDEQFLVFKSWARRGAGGEKHPDADGEPRERQSGLCKDAWVDLGVNIRRTNSRTLNSTDEIVAAIRDDRPIVACTEYEDGDWRVRIDHPVKTINYSERERVFQTDTGPVLVPELTSERLTRSEFLVECFDLAFVAFNSTGWAEFVVNVPTPIADGVVVDHYSEPRRIEPTRNMLLQIVDSAQPPKHHLDGDRTVRSDAAEVPF